MISYVCVFLERVVGVVPRGEKFFWQMTWNSFLKSYSEMSLKKVMCNQHDPYMHTPISAFGC